MAFCFLIIQCCLTVYFEDVKLKCCLFRSSSSSGSPFFPLHQLKQEGFDENFCSVISEKIIGGLSIKL